MTLRAIFEVVLALAGLGLMAYIVLVLTDLRRTLVSMDRLAKDLDEQVIPLTTRANQTLDEINAELVRVDGIVRNIEDVSQKVSLTAEVARHALSSPLVKVASWSAGMRKAVSTLARHEESGEHDEDEGPKEGSA